MINGQKLSAAHIRYLLVMYRLSESGSGMKSVTLAEELGVSRPSVHAMLNTLAGMELIRKQSHSAAYLTAAGLQTAQRYHRYYEAALQMLSQYIETDSSTSEAVCALIAAMSGNSLEALAQSRERK